MSCGMCCLSTWKIRFGASWRRDRERVMYIDCDVYLCETECDFWFLFWFLIFGKVVLACFAWWILVFSMLMLLPFLYFDFIF